MAFRGQRLGKFIDARMAATELLREEGAKDRNLSFEEALVMQVASHILSERDAFFGLEIVRLIDGAESGSIYPTLSRFEKEYEIVASSLEDADYAAQYNRRSRRLYVATELGERVFSLFSPRETTK